MYRNPIDFLFLLSLLTATATSASVIDNDVYATVARFQEYLRINTSHPFPDYATSTCFLLAQAASLGLHAETLEFVAGKPIVFLSWAGLRPSLPFILLNSHTDVVPAEADKWHHPPFSASTDAAGKIFARGSQHMKCVGVQYIEAIRLLKAKGLAPDRTIHISFLPDEEIGGHDGAEVFAKSTKFQELNVGVVLDEGLASMGQDYRIFNAERSPWFMVIKARGASGHGARMYDGTAMGNLFKSLEVIRNFRTSQFDLVKSGRKAEGEVVSVNMVFLRAGSPSSTSQTLWQFHSKVPEHDMFGNPDITTADCSNQWWTLFKEGVKKANGRLGKPDVFPASTDARYVRFLGIPEFGFSPMANTPVLLHDHNEFLNKDEYLKGIAIYESIIREFATFGGPVSWRIKCRITN